MTVMLPLLWLISQYCCLPERKKDFFSGYKIGAVFNLISSIPLLHFADFSEHKASSGSTVVIFMVSVLFLLRDITLRVYQNPAGLAVPANHVNNAVQNGAVGNDAVLQNRVLGNAAVQNGALGNAAVQNRAVGNDAVQNRVLGNAAVQNRALGNEAACYEQRLDQSENRLKLDAYNFKLQVDREVFKNRVAARRHKQVAVLEAMRGVLKKINQITEHNVHFLTLYKYWKCDDRQWAKYVYYTANGAADFVGFVIKFFANSVPALGAMVTTIKNISASEAAEALKTLKIVEAVRNVKPARDLEAFIAAYGEDYKEKAVPKGDEIAHNNASNPQECVRALSINHKGGIFEVKCIHQHRNFKVDDVNFYEDGASNLSYTAAELKNEDKKLETGETKPLLWYQGKRYLPKYYSQFRPWPFAHFRRRALLKLNLGFQYTKFEVVSSHTDVVVTRGTDEYEKMDEMGPKPSVFRAVIYASPTFNSYCKIRFFASKEDVMSKLNSRIVELEHEIRAITECGR